MVSLSQVIPRSFQPLLAAVMLLAPNLRTELKAGPTKPVLTIDLNRLNAKPLANEFFLHVPDDPGVELFTLVDILDGKEGFITFKPKANFKFLGQMSESKVRFGEDADDRVGMKLIVFADNSGNFKIYKVPPGLRYTNPGANDRGLSIQSVFAKGRDCLRVLHIPGVEGEKPHACLIEITPEPYQVISLSEYLRLRVDNNLPIKHSAFRKINLVVDGGLKYLGSAQLLSQQNNEVNNFHFFFNTKNQEVQFVKTETKVAMRIDEKVTVLLPHENLETGEIEFKLPNGLNFKFPK